MHGDETATKVYAHHSGLKFFSLEVQPVVNVRVRCLGRMSEF